MAEGHPLSTRTVKRLMLWYRKHQRVLPWRNTKDAYRIWISEILLQQTQVETVMPYYERFLAAFPSVEALAKAPLDRVLKVWEGCGYYARARNLHKAARQVMEDGGKLPRTAVELRKLPGIGPYTSAAIASIAFAEPVAVLDGNVERVLSRVLCERRVMKLPLVQKRLRVAATRIVIEAVELGFHPGDVNQAMMEIGATVCRPLTAECKVCPLRRDCRAYTSLSDVTVLPKRAVVKAIPHYDIGAAIIRKGGKILITQRPPHGLLGGLWEFPGGKVHPGETLPDCVRREIGEELGIEVEVQDRVISVDHAFTHFRITLHCFNCTHRRGRIRKLGVADFRWVTPEQLDGYAFPKADRVVIRMLSGTG